MVLVAFDRAGEGCGGVDGGKKEEEEKNGDLEDKVGEVANIGLEFDGRKEVKAAKTGDDSNAEEENSFD